MLKYGLFVLAGTAVCQMDAGAAGQAMASEHTGVFGEGPVTMIPTMLQGGFPGPPKGINEPDESGGSGPYKANFSTVPDLANHTIFAPIKIPRDVKLPVILWGEGGCMSQGTGFKKFLTEIASHGYYVIANGAPNGNPGGALSTSEDMPKALEWVYANAGKGALETVDKTKIAATGQSCGGIQAYSASLDKRITLTGIFNSGLISQGNQAKLKTLNGPIGYFLGGPVDIAYNNGESDYAYLGDDFPATKLNYPSGHMGTYWEYQGGAFAVAAVAFFDWHMKGNDTAAQLFLDPWNPDHSDLTKKGFQIVSKSKGFKTTGPGASTGSTPPAAPEWTLPFP